MGDEALLESISKQLVELVRHVAEVRASNKRLESRTESIQSEIDHMRADIDHMRGDIETLKKEMHDLSAKVDERTGFLPSKIDHFIEFVSQELTRTRTRIEHVDHASTATDRRLAERLDAIEVRLARLEAAR